MNHPPQLSLAAVEHQIDIALQFVSAVQHLSRYHRLGLTLAEAIDEAASEGASPTNESVDDGGGPMTPGPATGNTSRTPGSPTNVASLISSLGVWAGRMATAFNDDEPWPHPQPTKGWPNPATW